MSKHWLQQPTIVFKNGIHIKVWTMMALSFWLGAWIF